MALELSEMRLRQMKNSLEYGSADDGKIFQKQPIFSKPSQFKLKGWTETVVGYQNEAKQLTMCLLLNRKLLNQPYRWAIHININVELPPTIITSMWTTACRTMRRRGLVGLWVREPNKANKVHYHMIVLNDMSKRELERIVEEAMPDRQQVKWRKRVEIIDSEWNYCHYISKCKVSQSFGGHTTQDKYASKRLLFKPHLKFKKYGSIGSFWVRPKKTLWDEIKETERRIAEGLDEPHVRALTQHVFDLLDGTVALHKIERSFGRSSDAPSVQRWINSLFSDDWATAAVH
jgi:hypothetical protein